jgi:hypothetical protein
MALSRVGYALDGGINSGLAIMVLLVFFTIVFRRRAFGTAALYVLILVTLSVAFHMDRHTIPIAAMIAGVVTFVAARYGLLAVAVLQLVFGITFAYPFTIGLPSWTLSTTMLPLIVIVPLAAWAFKTALGGQSIFPEED